MVFNQDEDFFKKEPKLARGVSIYLENSNGEFLMQLRTVSATREPGKWTPISGALEVLEDPEVTVVREVKEELGVNLQKIRFFRDYFWISHDSQFTWYNHNFVFYALANLSLATTYHTEGQKISYLPVPDILKMDLAFNHKEDFRDLLAWLSSKPK
ncbi:MAG: NUDIX hydrolase [Candidatus Liptonbacteria bacterium]|nr:NUDIX hydrolase [Candidatus Liptonbacteria bacterium]